MRDFHSTNNVLIDLTDGASSHNENVKKSTNIPSSNSNKNCKSNNFLALVSPSKTITSKRNLLLNNTPNKPTKNGLNNLVDEHKPIRKITPMHLKLYESTQQTV